MAMRLVCSGVLLLSFCAATLASEEERVQELIQRLRSTDRVERLGAIEALGELGPAAQSAVPELTRLLLDRRDDDLWHVVETLRKIGPPAVSASSDLRRLMLEHADPFVRSVSARALCRIGPLSHVNALALTVALKDKDASVREEAANALGRYAGEGDLVLPELLGAAGDVDAGVRASVVFSLGRFGPIAAGATPVLIQRLSDSDSNVRACAAGALGRIGADAERAVPALIMVLSDSDHVVRNQAAGALGAFGGQAHSAIPPLLRMLGEPGAKVVVRSLLDIGVAQKLLIDATASKNTFARDNACLALGQRGRGDTETIAALLRRTKDEDTRVRLTAIEALRALDFRGEELVQAYLDLLTVDDPQMKHQALSGLAELGPRARGAIPTLIRLLGDSSFLDSSLGSLLQAHLARRVLRKLGPPDESLLPELESIAGDGDEPAIVRREAITYLHALESGAREASDTLIQCLKAEDSHIRSASAYALGSILAPGAEEGLALAPLLHDGDAFTRIAAARSLARLGIEEEAALAVLKAALHSEQPRCRIFAAQSLASSGQYGDEGVRALIAELASEDVFVREYAATAVLFVARERPEVMRDHLDDLAPYLEDEDDDVRRTIASVIELLRDK